MRTNIFSPQVLLNLRPAPSFCYGISLDPCGIIPDFCSLSHLRFHHSKKSSHVTKDTRFALCRNPIHGVSRFVRTIEQGAYDQTNCPVKASCCREWIGRNQGVEFPRILAQQMRHVGRCFIVRHVQGELAFHNGILLDQN